MNDLPVPHIPVERVTPVRKILVLYRNKIKSQRFEAANDTWMFLPLGNAHYGVCGHSLDVIMLMDGITKIELASSPMWVNLFPHLKLDGVIMEAS